jgi:hypothetical protein
LNLLRQCKRPRKQLLAIADKLDLQRDTNLVHDRVTVALLRFWVIRKLHTGEAQQFFYFESIQAGGFRQLFISPGPGWGAESSTVLQKTRNSKTPKLALQACVIHNGPD